MSSYAAGRAARAARIANLGIREKRPDLPNYRDYGRQVWPDLRPILVHLQEKHGFAYASTRGLHKMLFEDHGHNPGLDTLRKVFRREELRGEVEVRWIKSGGRLPTGETAKWGTLQVRLPVNRRDRLGIASRARKVNHKHGIVRMTDVPPAGFPMPEAIGAPELDPAQRAARIANEEADERKAREDRKAELLRRARELFSPEDWGTGVPIHRPPDTG